MTVFAIDPTKNTASEETGRYRLVQRVFDISLPGAIVSFIIRRRIPLTDEMLERFAFTMLSEESFAEDWDSPEDAIYNDLP